MDFNIKKKMEEFSSMTFFGPALRSNKRVLLCRFATFTLFLFAILFFANPLSVRADETIAAGIGLAKDADYLWLIIAAALVFFMQVGFLFLETGLVRAKNSINVAVKNLIDFVIGFVTFFVLGFGLMFGLSKGGWIGVDLFFLDGLTTGNEFAFFIFQVTFMGTAATIVSGAVAERIRFSAYVAVSVFVTLVIYPIFGHWVWGEGWLSSIGFMDFAGSTVVHSVGGWVALAGVIVLGPRRGKFSEDGQPRHIYGHNLPLAVAGSLILWFGWFGFNGGSTLAITEDMPLIVANTSLAAAAGGAVSLILSWIFKKTPAVEDAINGVLGGLVAITAGCAYVTPKSAFIIGALAGVVVLLVIYLLENKLKLDDVIGAYAVHGGCGIFGTLAVAIFGQRELLAVVDGVRLSPLNQLGVQAIGVVTCAVWAFGLGLILFTVLKYTIRLRVGQEDEEVGLNVAEHGAKTAWLDLMVALEEQGQGDLTRSIPIEYGTEAGAAANVFNRVTLSLAKIIALVKLSAGELSSVSEHMSHAAGQLSDNAQKQATGVEAATSGLDEMKISVQDIAQNASQQTQQTAEASGQASNLVQDYQTFDQELQLANEDARKTTSYSSNGQANVQATVANMEQIQENVKSVAGFVRLLSDISERLELLSLNASIEAARGGQEARGFAIVAQEINSLAEETGLNAEQAFDRLEEVTASVKDGAQSLERTKDTFQTIFQSVQQLAGRLGDIQHQSQDHLNVVQAIQLALKQLEDLATSISDRSQSTAERQNEILETFNELIGSAADVASNSDEIKNNSESISEHSVSLTDSVGRFKIPEIPRAIKELEAPA